MYHCELCAGVCLYFTEVQPDRVRQLTAFSACSLQLQLPFLQ